MRILPIGKAIACFLAIAGCASWRPGAMQLPEAPRMSAQHIERDITWLADDAREGRGLGTDGLSSAANYIANAFERAGLSPGGDEGSYQQRFEMPVAIRVVDARVAIGSVELERGREFEALLASENGEVKSALVFAGYGISAPEYGYDDYEGIDAKGNVVLLLEDRPAADAPGLETFAGRHATRFLHRSYKIANARRQGARAVLLVPSGAKARDLPGSAGHQWANPTLQSSKIIAVAISRSGAERLMGAEGDSLANRQDHIDATGVPNSIVFGAAPVTVRVDIERAYSTVSNVVATLKGSDPALRHEVVVVGAHYDHLGRGEFSSLMPDRRGDIHNGADDNASGTAGLLELARTFGAQPRARRTLALVAFTGEEAGLVGSNEYLKRAVISGDDTLAMLNLDMVGRLRENRLTVFGSETSPDFPAIVRGAVAGTSLELSLQDATYVPSDQTTFHVKRIPVLLFFTGSHAEYHTPDDDTQLVNAAGEVKVLRATYRTARALLNSPSRPVFTEVKRRAGDERRGIAGDYGPYLGTVPDFTGNAGSGVLLQSVRAGSPAELAGLRAGDRIVEFDGASVANLQEYAALLFAARPGDSVEVVFLRGGQHITTAATLGLRR